MVKIVTKAFSAINCMLQRYNLKVTIIPLTFSATVTTPPTTTTTTTTTLPALVSTVAPPSCKSENLTRCVGDYEEAVSMALSSPRKNFPYFCR